MIQFKIGLTWFAQAVDARAVAGGITAPLQELTAARVNELYFNDLYSAAVPIALNASEGGFGILALSWLYSGSLASRRCEVVGDVLGVTVPPGSYYPSDWTRLSSFTSHPFDYNDYFNDKVRWSILGR